MTRRTERVASLIQSELGELVLKRLKDPRIGMVTITRVEITPDLKLAHVYYSVYGKDKEKEEAGRALEHAAGFLQRKIADALKFRFTPKLVFRLDDSLEESIRIQKILEDLRREAGR